jgi:hypothetical protein
MQIWSETLCKLFAHFAHKIRWIRARIVPQFCIVQIDASFFSSAVIIWLATFPPGVVHLRPVRPEELSRLLSDVGRSHPVSPWNRTHFVISNFPSLQNTHSLYEVQHPKRVSFRVQNPFWPIAILFPRKNSSQFSNKPWNLSLRTHDRNHFMNKTHQSCVERISSRFQLFKLQIPEIL